MNLGNLKKKIPSLKGIARESLKIAGYTYAVTATYIGTIVIAACIIAEIEARKEK